MELGYGCLAYNWALVFPTRSVFGKSTRWPSAQRGAALALGLNDRPMVLSLVVNGSMGATVWKARWACYQAQQTFPCPRLHVIKKLGQYTEYHSWALCAIQWLLAVVSDMQPPPTGWSASQPGGRLKQMVWACLQALYAAWGPRLVWGSPSCWPSSRGQAGVWAGWRQRQSPPRGPTLPRQLHTKLSSQRSSSL